MYQRWWREKENPLWLIHSSLFIFQDYSHIVLVQTPILGSWPGYVLDSTLYSALYTLTLFRLIFSLQLRPSTLLIPQRRWQINLLFSHVILGLWPIYLNYVRQVVVTRCAQFHMPATTEDFSGSQCFKPNPNYSSRIQFSSKLEDCSDSGGEVLEAELLDIRSSEISLSG